MIDRYQPATRVRRRRGTPTHPLACGLPPSPPWGANSAVVGRGHPGPPPPLLRPGLRAEPSLPFQYSCCGAFPAPIAGAPGRCRLLAAWAVRGWRPVALVGLLRRERPARQAARPWSGLSLRSAQRLSLRSFFCRLPPGAAARGMILFPVRAARARVCQAMPRPECPPIADIFCLAPGARGQPRPCSPLRGCALPGGAERPAPPGTPCGRADAAGGVFHGFGLKPPTAIIKKHKKP